MGSTPLATDAVTYTSVHRRIAKRRGPARDYRCVDCDGVADDWSYDGADPEQLIDARRRMAYSLDPSYYSPRCRSCHRLYDRPVLCQRGHRLVPENLYEWVDKATGKQHRKCLACRDLRNLISNSIHNMRRSEARRSRASKGSLSAPQAVPVGQ